MKMDKLRSGDRQAISEVFLLVDLPPPTHGMSNVNLAVFNYLSGVVDRVHVLNTAPSYGHRFFATRLYVFIKLFHFIITFPAFLSLLWKAKKRKVYRSINGGAGQIYDCIYLAFMRAFGVEVCIHHHSFAYLNVKTGLFRCLVGMAGPKAKHIVLGEAMRDLLLSQYSISKTDTYVLSNATFLELPKVNEWAWVRRPTITLGYLSNVTKQKGFDLFIETYNLLKERGVAVSAVVAGPLCDEFSRDAVASISDKDFSYLGPVYGEEKEAFFKKVDVFIFPTKYVNEAEPLVIYEAAMFGCVCVAITRGCISEMLKKVEGYGVSTEALFPDSVVDVISGLKGEVFSGRERLNRVEQYCCMADSARTGAAVVKGLLDG